jgi:hypothetical protein
VLSEIVVGLGASLGREAAPKLMGALSGGLLARWTGMDAGQRRLLVACGAGLAAVYDVPLAGALFTAEIMIGVITLPVALPALVCSGVATVTAWISLPDQAVYLGVPDHRLTVSALVWTVVAGPLIGIVAVGFIRLIAFVSHHRARGRQVQIAPLGAFGLLAGLGQFFPQLFGNGKGIALDAFMGTAGCCSFSRCWSSSPWSRPCVWGAARQAACSPRRRPPARRWAASSGSPGRISGPAHRSGYTRCSVPQRCSERACRLRRPHSSWSWSSRTPASRSWCRS